MSQRIYGSELPNGTVVYVKYHRDKTYHKVMSEQSSYRHLEFIYDPNDGLFASELAREYWNDRPQYHPCLTLFYLLYKKLEIRAMETCFCLEYDVS